MPNKSSTESGTHHGDAEELARAVEKLKLAVPEATDRLKKMIAEEAFHKLHAFGIGDGTVPDAVEERLEKDDPLQAVREYVNANLKTDYGDEFTFDELIRNPELQRRLQTIKEEREKLTHTARASDETRRRAAEVDIELSAEEMELVTLYNKSPRDFNAKYGTQRFGVLNAMERRRSLKIPPDFRTDTAGDYIFVETKGKVEYYAFPRPSLTFQESSYSPGAMGMVYDCVPSYDKQVRYTKFHVIKPAIFEDKGGGKWAFKEKGILDLGEGEKA